MPANVTFALSDRIHAWTGNTMSNKTDWTRAEKREIAELEEAGNVIRTGQLVALAVGLWGLFAAGDWERFAVCIALAVFLQMLLPVVGPHWDDRAADLDEKAHDD